MIIDLSTLQKEHSAAFRQAQAGIIQSQDQFRHERYFFTFAEKEGGWFGAHVNIVLKQEANSGQYFLFFQKTVKMRDELGLTPSCESTKLIRLNRIKLAARKKKNLVIVIMSQQQKLEENNIKFGSEEIARRWQNLIYAKKNQENQVDNNDRVNFSVQLKQARAKLKFCEDQLIQERRQKDEILKCLNIMTEQLNHCKRSNSLLETQINEVMRSTTSGNSIESDRRIQQLQDRCKKKQAELFHLSSKIHNLERYTKDSQQIFKKMETQLNGCRRQMGQLLKNNQDLRGQIKTLQQEKDDLMDKVLQRNQQIRSKDIHINKSVIIDNKQDLARSIEVQSVLLSFRS